MKKKVLFVATVDSHIELFHLPFLKMFKERGYEVHVATESDKPIKYCDKKVKLPIRRSPFRLISNYKAVKELRKIAKREKYEIIHCHTPVGGVVARLAARSVRKTGTRVIYTAHGFHFYTGAPLHFWLMFYPVEWYLAKYTDTLITINNEDYGRAKKKFEKRCRDIQYVPGVGVDPEKFKKKLTAKQKTDLRKSLGLSDEDRVLIFPAELSKRKNQIWLIKTLRPLFDKNEKMHLLLPGRDSLNGKCQELVGDLGLEKQIHFLGFREDISELLQVADIAVSSSRQEGLPINIIEAMIMHLPVVALNCRGVKDLSAMGTGIELVEQGDFDKLRKTVLGFEKNLDFNTGLMASDISSCIFMKNIMREMRSIYRLSSMLSNYYDKSEREFFDACKRKHEKKSIHPKVSVCVPVYNAETYLSECLDSLLGQTLDDLEIICVNDGSTDGSDAILAEYAKKYNSIKVIKQKNMGLGGARDSGVANASGEYIGFVDADDVVDSEMYETLYNLARESASEIAFCNLSLFPNSKTKKKIWFNSFNGEVTGEFLYRNTQPWNKIFARDLFNRLNAKFEKNDCVCLPLMINARGLVSTNKRLYCYRVGHESMSTKFKINEFMDTVEITIKQKEDIYSDKKLAVMFSDYFDFMIIYTIVQTLTVAIMQDNNEIYKRMKSILDEYDYKNNSYCKKILKKEQGSLKYFAIIYILPKSYNVSNFLINKLLKKDVR